MDFIERLTWIRINDCEIFKVDMSNMDSEELVDFLDFAITHTLKLQKSDMLLLYDLTDTRLTSQSINRLKFITKRYGYLRKRSAVLGLNGPRRIIFNGVMIYTENKMKAFSNYDDAIRFLTSE
jgi:hypothetical protein